MEPNKILSASILDLIFDDRNKEYGAYELRKTYQKRVIKSLLITAAIAFLVFTGAALASSLKPDDEEKLISKVVTITEIDPKKDEPIPPPEQKKPEPVQVKTEKLTTFRMVPEDVDPPPTQEDFKDANVGTKTIDGPPDVGITDPKVEDPKGIIEGPKNTEPDIWTAVEVPASYNGDWVKFLTRNLNANAPVENNAPAGRYTVLIQFVVDKEGNLSDIVPLTNYGFGMEQEAIRVLKKAKGWKAGIQNGHQVTSYHKQPITFVVEQEQ